MRPFGQAIGLSIGVLALGAAYVIIHEARRKRKRAQRLREDEPISKETLLKILNKSAENSRVLIEKIRTEVARVKETRNLSDEHAVQLFQQNFEHSLDQLIGAIRKQYNVTEKAMDSSFKLHQSDPEVQAAIHNMRMLSTSAAGSSAGASGSADEGAAGSSSSAASNLTREKLKEIMSFNAQLLERELQPIKEEMARQRRLGRTPQVDSQALLQLQARISEEVKRRYGVTDEQVMAAVERFGAREDPAFKDILQRIATTLHTSLQ